MIKHIDIPSERFFPEEELLLVRPRELPKGEVEHNGIVLQMEQNTSVVDRPTFGRVVSVGKGVDEDFVNCNVIWVEQDGIDVELMDGRFMVLKLRSILGRIK